MTASAAFLSPSEAAARLGVSAKALRLYEERGLVSPLRSEVGWRAYGPEQMARLSQVEALRALGLTLGQTAKLLAGDAGGLGQVLAIHQQALELQMQGLAVSLQKVANVRSDLMQGKTASLGEIVQLAGLSTEPALAFDLPWPWGGERFELREVKPVTYIIGALGSGKTRLAQKLAEVIEDASFLGLDRLEADASPALQISADGNLRERVENAVRWLVDDGAESSDQLLALLVGILSAQASTIVVDMVEEGLSHDTQEALAAYFRRGGNRQDDVPDDKVVGDPEP